MSITPKSSRSAPRSWRPWESPEGLTRRPLSPRKQLFVANSVSNTVDCSLSALENVVSKHPKLLQSRILSLANGDVPVPTSHEGTLWLEVTRKNAVVLDSTAGPIHQVRLVVNSSNWYQLQVTWPIIRTTKSGILQAQRDFEKLLYQLLPESNFTLCPGIVDYQSQYGSSIRYKPKSIKTISVGEEVVRYEAENCLLWHRKTDTRVTIFDRTSGMCKECKNADRYLARRAKVSNELSSGDKMMRTFPSSTYPLSYLSPASQKVRVRRIMDERKALNMKIKQFDHLSVSLDEEQSEELADIVQSIDSNPTLRAELDELLLEADEHCEGHGAILQEMWETDAAADYDNFMNDQQNCATGNRNNRWNMITYRMALAVYSRSPAAYEALKSFKILQLPCKSSLQSFMTANRADPGVNEEKVADQKLLYEAFRQQQIKEGKKKPLSKGVLIFDEVKVQSKVIWNTKSNRMVGLAMSADSLPSLNDIYRVLDDDHRTHQASYFLQFLWRDISSKFDVVGPYFSSDTNFEAKYLVSCLFEAMFVFETYNFEVLALVCDGASYNLSLLKQLCGVTGQYGSPVNSSSYSDSLDHIPSWFINPYSGQRTYLIICPSHQLKNMVSALYSS